MSDDLPDLSVLKRMVEREQRLWLERRIEAVTLEDVHRALDHRIPVDGNDPNEAIVVTSVKQFTKDLLLGYKP